MPPLQICDAPHAVAQSLQCAGSLLRSTQLVPHLVSPAEHIVEHAPTSQTSPAWQATPHAPQLAASLFLSTQPDAQRICPEGQDMPPPSVVIASEAASFLAPAWPAWPAWPP
jgi:hypothetical protein